MTDIDPQIGKLTWDPNGPELLRKAVLDHLTKLRSLTEIGSKLNAMGGAGGAIEFVVPGEGAEAAGLIDALQFLTLEVQGLREALFLAIDQISGVG